MRPRFGPANANRSAHSTAGPSRWTHRVGVAGGTCPPSPPPAMPSDLACRSHSPQRSRAAVQARGIASSPLVRIEGLTAFDAGGGGTVAACRDRLRCAAPPPVTKAEPSVTNEGGGRCVRGLDRPSPPVPQGRRPGQAAGRIGWGWPEAYAAHHPHQQCLRPRAHRRLERLRCRGRGTRAPA
jgi:hypothetical protein